MDCATFKRSIYHFQADEIPEKDRLILEGHLVECPACARRLDFEDRMLVGLKTRLRRQHAPAELESRIRGALAAPATSKGPLGWLRAPWSVAAIAASLLLAVLVVPAGRFPELPSATGEVVETHVIVIDLDCHRAGKTLAEQRACRHEKHLNAFRLRDGTIWNLSLAQEAARRLALDRSLRGHELVVHGRYYPELKTVWVTESSDLGNRL